MNQEGVAVVGGEGTGGAENLNELTRSSFDKLKAGREAAKKKERVADMTC